MFVEPQDRQVAMLLRSMDPSLGSKHFCQPQAHMCVCIYTKRVINLNQAIIVKNSSKYHGDTNKKKYTLESLGGEF